MICLINKFKNLLFILWICAAVSSCTIDQQCIDADDFGTPMVRVSANPTNKLGGFGQQYVPWDDSGLTLNGDDLLLIVKNWDRNYSVNNSDELSAWCAWLGPSNKPPSLVDVCAFLDPCTSTEGWCSAAPGDDVKLDSSPCLFTKGVGLYALVKPRGAANPNDDNKTIFTGKSTQNDTNPPSLIAHLGAPLSSYNQDNIAAGGPTLRTLFKDNIINYFSQDGFIFTTVKSDVAGGAYFTYGNEGTFGSNTINSAAGDYNGGKLYFKILDKQYEDNSGQYIVKIKSGVTAQDWDPFKILVKSVESFLFGDPALRTQPYVKNCSGGSSLCNYGIIRKIYESVLANSGYQNSVRALLTIFVSISAINFLIGNVKLNNQEIVVRSIKIIIVSQLLTSSTSWAFFYNNFFAYFIGGTQDIIAMLQKAGSTGPGGANIVGFMMAPHTLIKLSAMVALNATDFGYSLLFIIMYFVILIFLIIAIFNTTIYYITALVMISLVICLAPIMICFLLFETTKGIFDRWVGFFVTYSIRPILLAVGIIMIGSMVRHQIYLNLGFAACKQHLLPFQETTMNVNVRGNVSRTEFIYWWQQVVKVNESAEWMLVPESHVVRRGAIEYIIQSADQIRRAAEGEFCPGYKCIGQRFPSFPFADPSSPSDLTTLEMYQNGKSTSIKYLLFLSILAILIMKFNKTVEMISEMLTPNLGAAKAAGEIMGASNAAARGIEAAGMAVAKTTAKAAIRAPLKIIAAVATRGESVKSDMKAIGESIAKKAQARGQQLAAAAESTVNKVQARGQQLSDAGIRGSGGDGGDGAGAGGAGSGSGGSAAAATKVGSNSKNFLSPLTDSMKSAAKVTGVTAVANATREGVKIGLKMVDNAVGVSAAAEAAKKFADDIGLSAGAKAVKSGITSAANVVKDGATSAAHKISEAVSGAGKDGATDSGADGAAPRPGTAPRPGSAAAAAAAAAASSGTSTGAAATPATGAAATPATGAAAPATGAAATPATGAAATPATGAAATPATGAAAPATGAGATPTAAATPATGATRPKID